jgi:hypothetical protein
MLWSGSSSPSCQTTASRGVKFVTWAGDVTVLRLGEAEVVIARLTNGWHVSKHYDPTALANLEITPGELVELIAHDFVPDGPA